MYFHHATVCVGGAVIGYKNYLIQCTCVEGAVSLVLHVSQNPYYSLLSSQHTLLVSTHF